MLPGELLRVILLRSQEFQGRAGGRASAQREGEGRATRREVLLRSAWLQTGFAGKGRNERSEVSKYAVWRHCARKNYEVQRIPGPPSSLSGTHRQRVQASACASLAGADPQAPGSQRSRSLCRSPFAMNRAARQPSRRTARQQYEVEAKNNPEKSY